MRRNRRNGKLYCKPTVLIEIRKYESDSDSQRIEEET